MTGYYPTLGFDPAPGDVDVVQNLHETVSRVAGRLSSANDAVRQLGRGGDVWQGQAAQAFARRVGELPQHLTDGENSMSAACRALNAWSAALVDFQRLAAAYERQAADAAAAVSSARVAASAIARPGANASQAEVDEATQQAAHAKRKLDSASDELSRVISQAHGLLAEHDEMARRVAKSLRDASDVAPAKPGYKDVAMNNALNGRKLKGLGFALRALSIDPREMGEFSLFLRLMRATGPALADGLRHYSSAEQLDLSRMDRLN